MNGKWDERVFCKEEKEKRNSQGKDPRTFEENGQGGDLRTHETNSQGRDPRTLKKGGVLRKKRKEEKWKKKRKKKKKRKVKHRRSWWKKCKERIVRFFAARMKEEKKEKKGQKKNRRPRERRVPEKSGRWLFLFFLLRQNWLCVNAAAEGLQRGTEMMERMQQQEVQVNESRWMEKTPQRWRKPKAADRTDMRKEEKRMKCTLLNGSAWSTERKVHEKIQRKVRYVHWD